MGETDQRLADRAAYLISPEFCVQAGDRYVEVVAYGAAGAIQQLCEKNYLSSAPPDDFLDHRQILREILEDAFLEFH